MPLFFDLRYFLPSNSIFLTTSGSSSTSGSLAALAAAAGAFLVLDSLASFSAASFSSFSFLASSRATFLASRSRRSVSFLAARASSSSCFFCSFSCCACSFSTASLKSLSAFSWRRMASFSAFSTSLARRSASFSSSDLPLFLGSDLALGAITASSPELLFASATRLAKRSSSSPSIWSTFLAFLGRPLVPFTSLGAFSFCEEGRPRLESTSATTKCSALI